MELRRGGGEWGGRLLVGCLHAPRRPKLRPPPGKYIPTPRNRHYRHTTPIELSPPSCPCFCSCDSDCSLAAALCKRAFWAPLEYFDFSLPLRNIATVTLWLLLLRPKLLENIACKVASKFIYYIWPVLKFRARLLKNSLMWFCWIVAPCM